ncbi:hypothetical protein [Spongiactinospora sp. TRM90649]|uniref:hypothetical protein n=1 Tax=Spongiactinospora sp. TRM90649 TaxID=3031114 RepID=UPI0023F6A88F|nr:hypothetical protein [Spongiactinospora sp. TRM90649]MDF5751876.1 hypothetical protein [Spongiactinospora sp. TRM90649]
MPPEWPPGEEFLRRVAERLGMRLGCRWWPGRRGAVLGVPAAVPDSLAGVRRAAPAVPFPEEVVDTVGLLWDARQLTVEQIGQVLR